MPREIKHRIEITEVVSDDDSDFSYTVERQNQHDPTDWTILETGDAMSTIDAAEHAQIALRRVIE